MAIVSGVGKTLWPPPTSSVTNLEKRPLAWPQACAAPSASAPTKIPPVFLAKARGKKRNPADGLWDLQGFTSWSLVSFVVKGVKVRSLDLLATPH